ncbi:MerR family transcriptional regulator [Secundilactobacillus paracollinoides]|uniref:MerR family transcriptional regulator n=1 Tax=Secundilactobacillus paracollinoides TaxID=240427 RepID=A0A1B2J1F5_9LACO|nr:MerR family transcriptional regulator [Secundilactobacillus paracollinoides]ANZ62166.1 MerR family transcriptional regulator [Secundilactobacillus paracollinoides]ANZ63855.1 MerR family transcriptional regulator [Secundilactobacillus paracollinoides]ANZ68113.1 MerR family transcriptional regulator [Secundilactobacillus paracollinoides]
MTEKELQRSKSVLPIGTVMRLTELSARQIRYYEEQGLVIPTRTEGNRRLYSLNDIDRLLEIKDYLTEGINMAGIKEIYEQQRKRAAERKEETLTDNDVRQILHDEFLNISGMERTSGTSLHSQKPLE